MAKLLETKLPVAIGPIDSAVFNRLVRVLELSLNKVDVGATVNVNETVATGYGTEQWYT